MTITRRFQATAELGVGSQLLEWDAVSGAVVSSTKAKTGTYSFQHRIGQTLQHSIPATSQIRYGFHVNHMGPVNPGGSDVLRIATFLSGATTVIASVRWNIGTGNIDLVIGSTIVASAPVGVFATTDSWMHCGADIKVHGSAGWFNFYVDGVLLVSFAGDTDNAGATGNSILVSSTSSLAFWATYAYIDNFYCDDTTGEAASAAPPAPEFLRYAAAGNGTASQLTGSDGNQVDNYLLVDENPHDTDTTYVLAGSSGLRDLYDTATFALPAGWAINAVIPFAIARKTDAAIATTLKILAKNGASETLSAAKDLGSSYGLLSDRQTTQPGGAAWATAANVNAAEYGVESAGVYA